MMRPAPYSRTRASRTPTASSSHCHTGIHELRPTSYPLSALTLAGAWEGPDGGRSGSLLGRPDPRLGALDPLAGLVGVAVGLGGLQLGTGRRDVDLVRESGVLGEDRHPVVGDREEPAVDGGVEPLAVHGLDLDDAVDQEREHRHVVAQHADVALRRLGDDHRGLTGPHGPVGRDELDLQLVSVSHQRFFWISAHFCSTSSRPPHMKKACSATWSYSPSAILLNASMVSATGTVEPSMPVNCLAT